ncbi:hypothetical protein ACQ4PT_042734 [Festuca glaucescens]
MELLKEVSCATETTRPEDWAGAHVIRLTAHRPKSLSVSRVSLPPSLAPPTVQPSAAGDGLQPRSPPRRLVHGTERPAARRLPRGQEPQQRPLRLDLERAGTTPGEQAENSARLPTIAEESAPSEIHVACVAPGETEPEDLGIATLSSTRRSIQGPPAPLQQQEQRVVEEKEPEESLQMAPWENSARLPTIAEEPEAEDDETELADLGIDTLSSRCINAPPVQQPVVEESLKMVLREKDLPFKKRKRAMVQHDNEIAPLPTVKVSKASPPRICDEPAGPSQPTKDSCLVQDDKVHLPNDSPVPLKRKKAQDIPPVKMKRRKWAAPFCVVHREIVPVLPTQNTRSEDNKEKAEIGLTSETTPFAPTRLEEENREMAETGLPSEVTQEEEAEEPAHPGIVSPAPTTVLQQEDKQIIMEEAENSQTPVAPTGLEENREKVETAGLPIKATHEEAEESAHLGIVSPEVIIEEAGNSQTPVAPTRLEENREKGETDGLPIEATQEEAEESAHLRIVSPEVIIEEAGNSQTPVAPTRLEENREKGETDGLPIEVTREEAEESAHLGIVSLEVIIEEAGNSQTPVALTRLEENREKGETDGLPIEATQEEALESAHLGIVSPEVIIEEAGNSQTPVAPTHLEENREKGETDGLPIEATQEEDEESAHLGIVSPATTTVLTQEDKQVIIEEAESSQTPVAPTSLEENREKGETAGLPIEETQEETEESAHLGIVSTALTTVRVQGGDKEIMEEREIGVEVLYSDHSLMVDTPSSDGNKAQLENYGQLR